MRVGTEAAICRPENQRDKRRLAVGAERTLQAGLCAGSREPGAGIGVRRRPMVQGRAASGGLPLEEAPNHILER